MQLFSIGGQKQRIVSIARKQELSTVYNFEVDGVHNYFAGSSPVLVHNQDAIHRNFNDAVNEALQWLRSHGIDTSKATGLIISRMRLDPHYGKPIGVTFNGGGSYRIEFHDVDDVPRAHINVQAGKVKGPHVNFEGNQQTVNSIRRQLFNC